MPHVISVSGSATDEIAPDRAVLSVSLVSKDPVLAKAKKDNDAMAERLVAISHEFKIPKEKVETSGLHISPEYNYNDGKRRFIGYTVNRSLTITMDELSIYERVLSALVDAKIDQTNNIDFRLADPDAHAEKVRIKAFGNARAKAETLARAAGLKLGRVISMSEGGAEPIQPPRPMMMRAMAAADMAESSVAPTLPGMVTLHETVSVTFALE